MFSYGLRFIGKYFQLLFAFISQGFWFLLLHVEYAFYTVLEPGDIKLCTNKIIKCSSSPWRSDPTLLNKQAPLPVWYIGLKILRNKNNIKKNPTNYPLWMLWVAGYWQQLIVITSFRGRYSSASKYVFVPSRATGHTVLQDCD